MSVKYCIWSFPLFGFLFVGFGGRLDTLCAEGLGHAVGLCGRTLRLLLGLLCRRWCCRNLNEMRRALIIRVLDDFRTFEAFLSRGFS